MLVLRGEVIGYQLSARVGSGKGGRGSICHHPSFNCYLGTWATWAWVQDWAMQAKLFVNPNKCASILRANQISIDVD